MFFLRSKLHFFVALLVLVLLNAYYKDCYCAYIYSDNNQYSEDNRNHLSCAQFVNSGNPADTSGVRTYQTVSNRRNFQSITLSSAYGFQRPTFWNQQSSSGYMMVGTTIKQPEAKLIDKKQQHSAKNGTVSRPIKPIGSLIDKNTHNKQTAKIEIAHKSKRQHQKSIDSIDNKKMLDLSFIWPIKGRVLKRFSLTRNKGIDIVGKQGQPVKSAEAGKVVYCAQGLIGFGKLIIIKHNDDYLSAYANNSRLLVNEGQNVKKGQVIAKVGDVGIKRTSLHFEIRKNGKPVNPIHLLPKK